jgi:hypothetical protein
VISPRSEIAHQRAQRYPIDPDKLHRGLLALTANHAGFQRGGPFFMTFTASKASRRSE